MRSVLLAVLLTMSAAHAGAQESSVRAAAPREGTVSIRTHSGSVRVVGWDRAEVAVSGDDRARISSSGGVTRVRPSAGHEGLEVRVPAGSRVEVSTQSGGIQVSGVSGAVDLQSTSGSFRISGSPRMVSVEGISGDTEMLGSTETLRVQTVSGGISVPRAQGFLELSTVSGDIRVVSQGVRRATLRTVSGWTEFSGVVPRNASLHFENTSGTAELRVPSGVSARFDLSSLGNGEIDNKLGPEPQRRDRHSPAESVRFTHGAGEAEITARTVSGTIRLRKQ
jgi:DUF4097 and DUF4098 domain-containing protein YvlB